MGITQIQWGSEIRISNGQKLVRLQMVWIFNGIRYQEAQPFEIWTNDRHFVKNQLKTGQKHMDFECG